MLRSGNRLPLEALFVGGPCLFIYWQEKIEQIQNAEDVDELKDLKR